MKKLISSFVFLIIAHCTLNVEKCNAQWVQISNGIGTDQFISSC